MALTACSLSVGRVRAWIFEWFVRCMVCFQGRVHAWILKWFIHCFPRQYISFNSKLANTNFQCLHLNWSACSQVAPSQQRCGVCIKCNVNSTLVCTPRLWCVATQWTRGGGHRLHACVHMNVSAGDAATNKEAWRCQHTRAPYGLHIVGQQQTTIDQTCMSRYVYPQVYTVAVQIRKPTKLEHAAAIACTCTVWFSDTHTVCGCTIMVAQFSANDQRCVACKCVWRARKMMNGLNTWLWSQAYAQCGLITHTHCGCTIMVMQSSVNEQHFVACKCVLRARKMMGGTITSTVQCGCVDQQEW